MSPASSGNLEVERYIGACLISQNRTGLNGLAKSTAASSREYYPARSQVVPADLYPGSGPGSYVNHLDGRFRIQRCNSVDVWAGGMPLISFANHQRRGRSDGQQVHEEHQHSPLSRLAVHTQGAPLILTKSYNHRKNKVNRNNNNGQRAPEKKVAGNNKCPETPGNNNVTGVDAISVASDESSGSANSENCLPRIIKPRKRRKRDRKPPLLGRALSQDGFSTDSASPDIDAPLGVVTLHRSVLPFNFNDPYAYRTVPDSQPNHITNSTSLVDRYQIANEISETPKLHHAFEDIEDFDDGKDINGNQPTSTCQCRYCDPSGQIWDVDRSCYSPFLTPPKSDSTFHFPGYTSPSDDDHCLVHSMSSVSLEEEQHKGDRKMSRDLEVSTEIVTSLNGHRDLEIKFFSTPSVDSVRDKCRYCGKYCEMQCVVHSMCKFVSEE